MAALRDAAEALTRAPPTSAAWRSASRPPTPGVPDKATIDAYTVAGVDRLILARRAGDGRRQHWSASRRKPDAHFDCTGPRGG